MVYFDSDSSSSWAENSNFNIADYTVLHKEGNNYLLKLKNDRGTSFYDSNPDLDGIKNKKTESVSSGEILIKHDNFIGISILFSIKKDSLNKKYAVKLKKGNCNESGEEIMQKVISQMEIKDNGEDRYFKIKMEENATEMSLAKLCVSVYDESTGELEKIIRTNGKGAVAIKMLHEYRN